MLAGVGRSPERPAEAAARDGRNAAYRTGPASCNLGREDIRAVGGVAARQHALHRLRRACGGRRQGGGNADPGDSLRRCARPVQAADSDRTDPMSVVAIGILAVVMLAVLVSWLWLEWQRSNQ